MGKKRTFKISQSQAGYSLLSTAAMLVVVGLGVSSGLALYKSNEVRRKMQKNKDIQNTLKAALKDFQAKHGRYPCPADPRAGIDATGTGTEVTFCSGSGVSTAVGRGGEQVAIGAIPTRTLNIDDTLAFDAWGSKITYAVTRDYTSSPVPSDGGAISIVDSSGTHLTSTPGNAIYALILPGEDKRGFFSKNGGGTPNDVCNTSVPAGENCDNDATFYSSVFTNQSDTDQIFTASVDYRSGNPTPYTPPTTTPPPPTVVPPPPVVRPPVVRPPVGRPVAGGGGGSSGGGRESVDVDGDGRGDFRDMSDARAAGFTRGSPVNNCSGACNGPSRSTGGSSGGGGSGGSGCFIAGTMVKMADGTEKAIETICLGDNVLMGGRVITTAAFLVNEIYDYKGVVVSGSHAVFEDGVWLRVRDAKHAVLISDDVETAVYVHVNENHRIVINDIVFADFQEVSYEQSPYLQAIDDSHLNILNATNNFV